MNYFIMVNNLETVVKDKNNEEENTRIKEIKERLENKLEEMLKTFNNDFNPVLASLILSGSPVDGSKNSIVEVEKNNKKRYAITFSCLMSLKSELSRLLLIDEKKESEEKVNLESFELGAHAKNMIESVVSFYVEGEYNGLKRAAESAKKLKERLGSKEISFEKLDELRNRFEKYSEEILKNCLDEDDDFSLEEYYNKIKNCDPYIQFVYFALTHPRIKEIFKEEKRKEVEKDLKDYVLEKMRHFKEIAIDLINLIAGMDRMNKKPLYQSIKNYEKTWQNLDDGKLEEFWKKLIGRIDEIPYKFYEFSVKDNSFCVEEKKNLPTFKDIKGYERTKKNLKRLPLEKNKTILIYGPAGVGKTMMAEAFIKEKLNKKEAFLALDIGKTIDNIPLETIEDFLKEYVFSVISSDDEKIIIKCDEVDGKILSSDRGETTKRLEMFNNDKNLIWVFTSNIGVGEKYNPLTVTDDPSVLRRFGHIEHMDLPNNKEREEILKYYLELHFGEKWDKYKDKNKIIRKFVEETKTYSGWEIETMVRKAKEIGEKDSDIAERLKKGKEYIERNYRKGLEKRRMENNGIDPNYNGEELKLPFSPNDGLSPYII